MAEKFDFEAALIAIQSGRFNQGNRLPGRTVAEDWRLVEHGSPRLHISVKMRNAWFQRTHPRDILESLKPMLHRVTNVTFATRCSVVRTPTEKDLTVS